MTNNLTCAQVSALLPFYIEDKLSLHLRHFVESHLEICPKCTVKFEALKKMLSSLHNAHESVPAENLSAKIAESSFSDELRVNLSAYVDNELNDIDSIKVKKQIISNPEARKEVENMYVLKKTLATAFEKEKNDFKDDYSKLIFDKIDLKSEVYAEDSFVKIFVILTSCLTVLMVGALVIFLN